MAESVVEAHKHVLEVDSKKSVEEQDDENLLPSQASTKVSSSFKEGDKNDKTLKCVRCGSTVLLPDMAELILKQFSLPAMEKKLENALPGTEATMEKYWLVNNIYTFENIGFTKEVGEAKYLICADCEVGPIGYHDISTKLSYVSADRVTYS